jgi:hypothetical protein
MRMLALVVICLVAAWLILPSLWALMLVWRGNPNHNPREQWRKGWPGRDH